MTKSAGRTPNQKHTTGTFTCRDCNTEFTPAPAARLEHRTTCQKCIQVRVRKLREAQQAKGLPATAWQRLKAKVASLESENASLRERLQTEEKPGKIQGRFGH